MGKKQRYTRGDPLIISASKCLYHLTAPAPFPPCHKSPDATVIPVPGGGTLGRQSVCSQHGQSEHGPLEQLGGGTWPKAADHRFIAGCPA